MNDEEINIAVAESLGWKNCKVLPKPQKYWDVSNVPEMVRIGSPPVAGSCTFPDYCNSLNAMNEAEKALTIVQQDEYWDFLWDLTGSEFELCHADARRRAEAFLKTVGKWEE